MECLTLQNSQEAPRDDHPRARQGWGQSRKQRQREDAGQPTHGLLHGRIIHRVPATTALRAKDRLSCRQLTGPSLGLPSRGHRPRVLGFAQSEAKRVGESVRGETGRVTTRGFVQRLVVLFCPRLARICWMDVVLLPNRSLFFDGKSRAATGSMSPNQGYGEEDLKTNT